MTRVVYKVNKQEDGAKYLCEQCLADRGYNMDNYRSVVRSIAWDKGCDDCDYEPPK